MLRNLIDYITKFVAWARRKRIIISNDEVVKVNLGSGLSVATGWINVDASLNSFFSKWPQFVIKIIYRTSGSKKFYSQQEYCDILRSHIFIHHNVEYGIPFPDRSVDYLYSSHLLEHLFKEDAKKLLKEAYRVLKEGGVIRICVPDLEYPMSLYQKGDKEQALNYFFVLTKSGYFHSHKYMYDFELLKQLFEEAGFIRIERCSYRQSKTPDIDVLDNRPDETLYMEAIK